MKNFVKKVIRASAGTGKTYRLSLEYIGLLLKFSEQGLHFSEILVITFTRKATAEIRERIFNHLAVIVGNQSQQRVELCTNLEALLGEEIGERQRDILKACYHQMLINKNLVQISTIDSFTNTIFKTVIGPYLGVMDYRIRSTNDDSLLSEIYESILDEDSLRLLSDFFFRSSRKVISDYRRLIESIIRRRWIFDMMEASAARATISTAPALTSDGLLADFRQRFSEVVLVVQNFAEQYKGDKSAADILKSGFCEIFIDQPAETAVQNISQIITEKLADDSFLLQNCRALLHNNNIPFWNGNQIFKGQRHNDIKNEQRSRLDSALELFADWVLLTAGAKEQQEIIEISRRILKKYDDIKFRDKVFTYDDISYYTFRYLYEPELSLIEDNAISNRFYEYLTTVIRFVLIDEFQDTSVIQFKILFPMIKEIISGEGVKTYGGVIVVGDEKQSIYGWREGERDLLLNLDSVLLSPQSDILNVSYRSEYNIIQFVNSLFNDADFENQIASLGIQWDYSPVEVNKQEHRGFVKTWFRNISRAVEAEDAAHSDTAAFREFVEKELYPLISQQKLSLSGTAILARENRDIDDIARIFDELGIPYIAESSFSVIHHPAVKPIFYFYQFIVQRDIYNLLCFLRSDYVLLNPADLKDLTEQYHAQIATGFSLDQLLANCQHIAAVDKLWKFMIANGLTSQRPDVTPPNIGNNMLTLTKKLLEEYAVTKIFKQENDLKNIHLLLEVIAGFQNSNAGHVCTLQGFLEYCQEMEQDESFRQIGLEVVAAIRLLTIHKSKGLEFDTVFFFWKLSGRSKSDHGQIGYYPSYSADYSRLNRFVLTYNYDFALPFSHFSDLAEQKQIRDDIEELNLFYVAMTRTKANLFVIFTYQNKQGLEKYFSETSESERPGMARLMACCLYRKMSQMNFSCESSNSLDSGQWGEFVVKEESTSEVGNEKDNSFVSHYFNFDHWRKIKPIANRFNQMTGQELKRIFISERTIEKGNIAHYYLSFIKYDRPESRRLARARTIQYFGSLVSTAEIDLILNRIDRFLDENQDFFSAAKWDVIFTEHTIFLTPDSIDTKDSAQLNSDHRSPGKQLRLDRLMINKSHKKMLILDFKTGAIHEQDQLELYKLALSRLEIVQNEKYQIEAKYVYVNIDE